MNNNCLGYSVALCTYNGERFIAEQIKSILNQTLLPNEIIISDDNSTDNTIKVAEELLAQGRVNYRIVTNVKTKGVVKNFQNAIAMCNSPIIFTCDQDDVWLASKAEKIVNCFANNEKAMLVFSDGELTDGNLNLLGCSLWKSVGITECDLSENKWFSCFLNRCFVTGAAMAFRRELFVKDEIIPDSWLHDGWLAWKALAYNGLVPCPEKLIYYRQHGANVVGMYNVTSIGRIKKYIRNFSVMPKEHLIRYERYKDVKECLGNTFTEAQIQELDSCISFWEELVSADRQRGILKRIAILRKHKKNNDFKKFSNGNRGYYRELFLTFFPCCVEE